MILNIKPLSSKFCLKCACIGTTRLRPESRNFHLNAVQYLTYCIETEKLLLKLTNRSFHYAASSHAINFLNHTVSLISLLHSHQHSCHIDTSIIITIIINHPFFHSKLYLFYQSFYHHILPREAAILAQYQGS